MADGLFSYKTPGQLQQDYLGGLIEPVGGGNLYSQLVQTMSNAGRMMGYGAGRMFGGQVPGEAKNAAIQSVFEQVKDIQDPIQQYTAASQLFLKAGFPDLAMQARKTAQTEKLAGLQLEKAEYDIGTVRGQQILRTELGKLGDKATSEDVLAVFRKFGDPDKVAEFAQKDIQARAAARAKAELEKEKAQERAKLQQERLEAAAQRTRENNELRAQIAQAQLESRQATTALQQQLAQQRIDDLKAKAQEREREQKEEERALKVKQQLLVGQTQKMITRLGEAKDVVGTFSTGVQGLALSLVGGTPANTLANRLATIKANVGFDRLQAMREASPTGGALGQVAVQELFSLQAAEGSLDQNQSPEELTKNLNAIEQHYKTLQRIFSGDLTEEEAAKLLNTQPPPPGSGADWSIKKKG